MADVSNPIFSRLGVALGDNYSDAATFMPGGRIDKLDVTVYSGDVHLQVLPIDEEQWRPDDPIGLRAGFFRSLTGIGEVFEHGIRGFRLKRATAGVAASVDVTAFLR